MSNEENVERTWWYMGRRARAKGGLGNLWMKEDGETIFFKKFQASVVGCAYKIKTTPDGSSVYGSPRWFSKERHAKWPEWELEDESAYNADQMRLAEARVKKDERWIDTMTLAEVKNQIWDTSSGPQRTAILAMVMRYLGS